MATLLLCAVGLLSAAREAPALRTLVGPTLPALQAHRMQPAPVAVAAAVRAARSAARPPIERPEELLASLPVETQRAVRALSARVDRRICDRNDLVFLRSLDRTPNPRAADALTFVEAELLRCLGRRDEARSLFLGVAQRGGPLAPVAHTRAARGATPHGADDADAIAVDRSAEMLPDEGAPWIGTEAPNEAPPSHSGIPWDLRPNVDATTLREALGVARRADRDREALDLALALLALAGSDGDVDALDACATLAGRLGQPARQRACVDALYRHPEATARMRADAAVRHLTDLLVRYPGDIDGIMHAQDRLRAPVAESAFEALGGHQAARRLYWIARTDELLGSPHALAGFEAAWERAPLSLWGLCADERLARRGRALRSPGVVRRALHRPLVREATPDAAVVWDLLAVGLVRTATAEARTRVRAAHGADDRAVDLALALVRASGAERDAMWMAGGRYPLHRRSLASWERTPAVAVHAAWSAPFAAEFGAAADASGIPASWLIAIARRESWFDPRARSRVGARGLMQVRPSTARELMGSLPSIADTRWSLYDPATSTRVAAELFRRLEVRYGGCRAPMAVGYATGPNRVGRWIDAQPSVPSDLWLEQVPYPVLRNYAAEALVSATVHAVVRGETPPVVSDCEVVHRSPRRSR
jgi:soluble lytic murein transglycosylase-like protein